MQLAAWGPEVGGKCRAPVHGPDVHRLTQEPRRAGQPGTGQCCGLRRHRLLCPAASGCVCSVTAWVTPAFPSPGPPQAGREGTRVLVTTGLGRDSAGRAGPNSDILGFHTPTSRNFLCTDYWPCHLRSSRVSRSRICFCHSEMMGWLLLKQVGGRYHTRGPKRR